jgi:hypothetical protein
LLLFEGTTIITGAKLEQLSFYVLQSVVQRERSSVLVKEAKSSRVCLGGAGGVECDSCYDCLREQRYIITEQIFFLCAAEFGAEREISRK